MITLKTTITFNKKQGYTQAVSLSSPICYFSGSRYFYCWHKKVSGTFICCSSCPYPAGSHWAALNLALEQGMSGTAEGSGKLDHQPGLTAGAAGPPSLLQCLQACKVSVQDELGGRPGALITNRRLYARKQRNEGTSVCAT